MDTNVPTSSGSGPTYRTAVRVGARRAAIHAVKAGYEMVAGVGAFLEELVLARSGRREPDDVTDPLTRPTRIPLD